MPSVVSFLREPLKNFSVIVETQSHTIEREPIALLKACLGLLSGVQEISEKYREEYFKKGSFPKGFLKTLK